MTCDKTKRDMTRGCVTLLLLLLLDVLAGYNVVRKDPFAALSETLVTRQRAACDGESNGQSQQVLSPLLTVVCFRRHPGAGVPRPH